jgi:hypothetical protein
MLMAMAVRLTNPGDFERAGASKRRHGRVVCDGVAFEAGKCIGHVLDLSASGARAEVGGAAKVGQVFECRLSTAEDEVKLSARVVWRRGTSKGRSTIGLEYLNPSEDQKRELMNLLRTAMARHTIGKSA